MTETAQKISLNFRRVTTATIAGMTDATLGAAAKLDPVADLQREINRTKALLNDRDLKMNMLAKSERIEVLEKQVETLEDEIDEIKKKFTLGGIFSRRKQIADREDELLMVNAEMKTLKEDEGKMRKARETTEKRLEQLDEKLAMLEGRAPKPKKFKDFTL